MQVFDDNEFKKHILEKYDQISIFATYLEVQETDINYCLQDKSNKICNPLRDDRNPSLGFIYVEDNSGFSKIRMYDFADFQYRGDCFDLVGLIRHLRSNNKLEFITICKDIIATMKYKNFKNETIKTIYKEESFTDIHIEPRLWSKDDIDRWNSYGLPYNELKGIIFPLNKTYISNYIDYRYDEKDPGYGWISGYYKDKVLYNLYFPNRDRKGFKPRFKTNNKFYQLQCIHELKPADILIITKANKERLLIKRLLYKINKEHTIEVTALTSESIILTKNFVSSLYDIYSNIAINTDFDRTGLYTSRVHKQQYGMFRFVPTNGKYGTFNYGGKDLCDIYTNRGEQYCIDLLQECYNYLREQIYLENEKYT